MNRFDEIQGAARDVADWVCADPEQRNQMADDLIKLVSLVIQATGKGVAIDGEVAMNGPDAEADAAGARYLTGESIQTAAAEALAESVNPEVDLDRYERSGLAPAWTSRRSRNEIRPGHFTFGPVQPEPRVTDLPTDADGSTPPLFAPGAEAYYRKVLGLDRPDCSS